MPTRLSRYLRERIIRLWEEGNSISSIVTILRSEGKVTTRATVRKWIFRWQHCGLDDQYRSGRPSKVTAEMAAFMEAELERDDETTSAELERSLARKFGVQLSIPTIKRYLRLVLKWAVVRTRFGPMISIFIPISISDKSPTICLTLIRCILPRSFDSSHCTEISFAFLGILTLAILNFTPKCMRAI